MLPVKLPEINKLELSGNPLDSEDSWRKIEINGKLYERD